MSTEITAEQQAILDETKEIAQQIQDRVLAAIGDQARVTHVILALTDIISIAQAVEPDTAKRQAGIEYVMQTTAFLAKDAGIKQYSLFNMIEEAYKQGA